MESVVDGKPDLGPFEYNGIAISTTEWPRAHYSLLSVSFSPPPSTYGIYCSPMPCPLVNFSGNSTISFNSTNIIIVQPIVVTSTLSLSQLTLTVANPIELKNNLTIASSTLV